MTDKLTIAQIKAQEPEHFWHWITQLHQSFEAEILVALCVAAVLGALVSWLAKWSQGDAHGLLEYTLKNNFKRTVASILSALGFIIGLVTSGIFHTESGEFVGWAIVMINGFGVGFGSDSAINKGKRVSWTDEKRKEGG